MRSDVILFSSRDLTYICSVIRAAPGGGCVGRLRGGGGGLLEGAGLLRTGRPGNGRDEVKVVMYCSDFIIRRVTI